jgi:sugar lactone lactonase YvrE
VGSKGVGLALALAMLAAIGCGGGAHGGGGGSGGTGATGGMGAIVGGTCSPSATSGTLSIKISGTPDGVGFVSLGSGQVLTSSMDLTMAGGSYTVTANLWAEGGTTVRTAYTPTIDDANPCVRAGATTTVNVTYAPIETSGLVWTGVSNGAPSATLLGYDPATVATTGSALAAILADTAGSDGFTFDPFGNIWVTGASSAYVARYPAGMFASSGTMTADLVITSPSFGSGTPGPTVLAFDSGGDLWVSVFSANKVVMFTPDQLVASGNPTAAVEESGINAPEGIAFDFSGNMWVASSGDSVVERINPEHLLTSGSGADLVITAMTPGPVFSQLSNPTGLAFDGLGNLWVDYDGTIAMIDTGSLAMTGTLTMTPTIQLVTDVTALPSGIAFDELGGLWLAYSAGKFARLSSSQLTTTGPVTPATIITSGDLGSAGWFAIYPAPAVTPLAHALN